MTATTADKGELPGAKEPRFTFSKEWCLRMAELDEGDECGAGVETLPSPLHLQVAAIAVKYCHCKNPESTTLDERYDITKFDCVEDVLSFAQELVRTFGRPADKGEQECREAFEQWLLTTVGTIPIFDRDSSRYFDANVHQNWRSWTTAWNRRPTSEQQRATNEGLGELTDGEIMKVYEKVYGQTCFGTHMVISFARAIAHHLSSKKSK